MNKCNNSKCEQYKDGLHYNNCKKYFHVSDCFDKPRNLAKPDAQSVLSDVGGLLPCPFCGSQAEIDQTGKNSMRIRCKLCHIGLEQKVLKLDMGWLKNSLALTWNKRANVR